jgi:hypothetical protein
VSRSAAAAVVEAEAEAEVRSLEGRLRCCWPTPLECVIASV